MRGFKMKREDYIPKGSLCVKDKNSDAVAYLFEAVGKPCAMAFSGKSDKPAWHIRFRSPERRAEYVAEFFTKRQGWLKHKADKAAERKAFAHSLKVGDVLKTSWGYDQTNVEYFEVVRLIGTKMVEVWEIAQEREETGFMQGDCVPVPGRYLEKGERKRCKVLQGNGIKLEKWGRYASLVPMREVAPGVKVCAPGHWTAYA